MKNNTMVDGVKKNLISNTEVINNTSPFNML